MMGKDDLIDAIQQHNRTAANTFLDSFNEEELAEYLRRLRYMSQPRKIGMMWDRNHNARAVVTRAY